MYCVFLAILFLSVQVFSNKEFTRRCPQALAGTMLHNGIALTVSALVLAVCGGAQLPSKQMLLFTAVSGVNFMLLLTAGVYAMASGPLGLTSLLMRTSMLIPTVVGLLFWNESFTWMKIVGIFAMLGLFVINSVGGGKEGSGGAKWLMFTAVSMVLNGLASVICKSYQLSAGSYNEVVYCFWWFLFGAIVCWIVAAVMKLRGTKFEPWLGRPVLGKQMLLSSLVGFGTAVGNLFVMKGYSYMEASLLIPLIEGGNVLASIVLSIPLYKEKCTKKTLLCVVIGIFGIVMLSLA